MLQTTLSTLLKKRRRPESTPVHPQQGMKFGEVTMYLVERRMGTSRRNFLTSLARSKGFCVDDNLSFVIWVFACLWMLAEGGSPAWLGLILACFLPVGGGCQACTAGYWQQWELFWAGWHNRSQQLTVA
ncbi:hypothetical protein MHYP_G00036070 [Metynnis hypsauchen]